MNNVTNEVKKLMIDIMLESLNALGESTSAGELANIYAQRVEELK